jgi:signal transduction histidine kinase
MAFKFAARTLLELGKELISTDEVAVYELIKNSVDAQSPVTAIVAQVFLQRSHYDRALMMLRPAASRKRSTPAEVVEWLGSRIIVDEAGEHENFRADLDAAARNVATFPARLGELYRKYNWLEVRDQGHGMSLDELNEVYLTVGTRSRRRENIEGASFLGDKGVGRLSAMRLGDYLTVTTSRSGERHLNVLEIDWSMFGHDSDADVSEVIVEAVPGPVKTDRAVRGTIIHISDLAGDWSEARFAEILAGPIARMVDPFEPGRGNKLIHAAYNGKRHLIPSIPSLLLKSAHAVCVADFAFVPCEDGEEPALIGTMDYRLRDAKRPVNIRGVEIYSIAQKLIKRRGKAGHAQFETVPISEEALRALGSFRVEIYWYNRLVVEAVEGLTEKMQQTRAEISRWSGGPMLYRHGFRVLPYGNPDDDWLELDQRAFGSGGFKLNRQQVIGRVQVNAGHTALSEQTNREGLIESDPARALKDILKTLLHVEFRSLINDADEAHTLRQSKVFMETVAEFSKEQEKVSGSLAELKRALPRGSEPLVQRVDEAVSGLVHKCAAAVKRSTTAVEASVGEREKFVYLAGIGLMTEFIFHELDRAIKHTVRQLADARKDNPRSKTLEALDAQLQTLHKRVSAFDELTGEKRQSKSAFDLNDVVETVIASHRKEFERHDIALHFERSAPFRVKAVKGMVIQILENLVANATFWLKRQHDYQSGFQPSIHFDLDPAGGTLMVSDNGPGVDPERKAVIFNPFVTTKPAGQGRGLGLFISRELATYHGWKLQMGDRIGEYRKGRLNSFVLKVEEGN